jgi:two-component system catabolic regulation response regulator CreB/two-component system response regulator ChvI
MRIFIVDDEEDITILLKIGLEREGYHVDVYNDPVEALSNFRFGYDLVVLDIRMPKMTGFDLCREIRKIDELVRVCFFTAFEVYREDFHKMFPELSADCFLRKPMSIAEFSAAVKRLLGE